MNDRTRRDLAPDHDGNPTPAFWLDLPTLRMDDAGKLAAQKHMRERFADRERAS